MSRIHEALKKAEQDRAAVQVPDGGAVDAKFSAIAGSGKVSVGTIAIDPSPETGKVALQFAEASATEGVDAALADDLRTQCAHQEWHLDPNVNIFHPDNPNGNGAEQFRTLRSRLYQLRKSQALRTVLVTSSIPNEGKTFLTGNLAQAIVRQPDRRVLMIDADLRCSSLHIPLGAPKTPGLTDYLRGEADENAVLQQGPEGNLFLIAGGSEVKDPTELLSGGRMRTLLHRLAPAFDWILIDSPPCLPVSDTSILADLCDGILLVVRAGSTPSEIVQNARRRLQGRNVIGVVLNSVEEQSGYGSYYSNGYGSSSNGSRELSKP